MVEVNRPLYLCYNQKGNRKAKDCTTADFNVKGYRALNHFFADSKILNLKMHYSRL